MDLLMPELNGFEAIERLRADPTLEALRIIALSASVGTEDRARSKSCGANDFVPKPVRAPRLFAAIAQHLGVKWKTVSGLVGSATSPRGATHVPTLAPLEPEVMEALKTFARQGNISRILETLATVDVSESPGQQAFVKRVEKLTRSFALRPLRTLLAELTPPNES
jgi:DNA-binding response OmpR family regulator